MTERPHRTERQIIFDLETTGFNHGDGHRIVEIGAVEVVDGRPTDNTFHAYVNPERDVPDDAVRVHGLTTEFLKDKPVFRNDDVAQAFLNFIGQTTLIAHNGLGFDIPFLNDELKANGFPTIKNDVIDTLLLARKKFPGSPASLDALCSRFSIDTSEREKDGHGALLDSQLLAAVYVELTGGSQGTLTLENRKNTAAVQQNQLIELNRQRPEFLSAKEVAAHNKFIELLGEDCLWKEVLTPSSN